MTITCRMLCSISGSSADCKLYGGIKNVSHEAGSNSTSTRAFKKLTRVTYASLGDSLYYKRWKKFPTTKLVGAFSLCPPKENTVFFGNGSRTLLGGKGSACSISSSLEKKTVEELSSKWTDMRNQVFRCNPDQEKLTLSVLPSLLLKNTKTAFLRGCRTISSHVSRLPLSVGATARKTDALDLLLNFRRNSIENDRWRSETNQVKQPKCMMPKNHPIPHITTSIQTVLSLALRTI